MANDIIRQLGPHKYYFEPCAGSMAVLLAKEATEHETVCDLHGALTNLAWVVQNQSLAVELFNDLQHTAYCDDVFMRSREWLELDRHFPLAATREKPDPAWAYHYFIASWMGRNGVAGTERGNYQIATRWTPNGGGGPLRFRNATASIPAWWERLRNVHILNRDMFEVLPKIDDTDKVAIYADPPYFVESLSKGTSYLHSFTGAQHRQLAQELCRFKNARVVVSYYADPRLAELYPGWTVLDRSRTKNLHQQNRRDGKGGAVAPEVLLLNGAEYGGLW